jgi:hypothetical protein
LAAPACDTNPSEIQLKIFNNAKKKADKIGENTKKERKIKREKRRENVENSNPVDPL